MRVQVWRKSKRVAEDASGGKGAISASGSAYSKRNRSALDDITNNYVLVADLPDRIGTRSAVRAAQAQVCYVPCACPSPVVHDPLTWQLLTFLVASAGGLPRCASRRRSERSVVKPTMGGSAGNSQLHGNFTGWRIRRRHLRAAIRPSRCVLVNLVC